MARNDINSDLVRKLAALLEETGLSEIEYGTGTWRVRVAKHAEPVVVSSAPAAAPAPAADAGPMPASTATEAKADATHPGAITSPMVGTVYASPEPGAAPFVQIGDRVEQGQTLLLVEAMKTFNEIRAPRAGEVTEILVEDRMPVEYGDVLMVLS